MALLLVQALQRVLEEVAMRGEPGAGGDAVVVLWNLVSDAGDGY